jgi:hypothetical protein
MSRCLRGLAFAARSRILFIAGLLVSGSGLGRALHVEAKLRKLRERLSNRT